MTSNKTKNNKEIDNWESKTSVFVHFGVLVSLEGTFTADELSDIARIQREREKAKVEKGQSERIV